MSSFNYEVGTTASFEHHVTADDVERYRLLTKDDNPLHMDRDFARSMGFPKPVVHGMLVASLFSRIVGTMLPGKGALYLSQSLQFTRPVFPGDHLCIEGTVTQISPANRVLVVQLHAKRGDEKVLSGEARVQLLEGVSRRMLTMPEQPVALITGGSRGIGARTAELFGQSGIRVAINYHKNKMAAEQVCSIIKEAGGEAHHFQCDVSEPDEIATMLEQIQAIIGPVDILVNNAGTYPAPRHVVDDEFSVYENQYRLTIGAAFFLTQQVVPGMKERQFGRIINIASESASGQPPSGSGAYVAAKGALLSWTRLLAVELGPYGITVNAIAPGVTSTEMHAGLTERQRQVMAAKIPVRSLADTDDIAQTVLFLAGLGARHVHGQVIHVNGGSIMH